MLTDEQLIERYISDERTADPRLRNEPTIEGKGIPVWAVAGYCLHACSGSVGATVEAYKLMEEEVNAALAYYRRHKEEMDMRIGEEADDAP